MTTGGEHMPIEQHYTPRQVAEMLSMSRVAVERHLRNGTLVGVKPFGREWRVPGSEIRRVVGGQ